VNNLGPSSSDDSSISSTLEGNAFSVIDCIMAFFMFAEVIRIDAP